MLAQELMAKIGRDSLPYVLLFCPGNAPFGKDPWEPVLAERALDAITSHYVDPSMRDLAYSVFYADEAEPGQIVAEAKTLPFLAERRVIVVRNAERYLLMSGEKGSPLAVILDYLNDPADFTLLLFVSAKSDKRKKFYTACKAAGDVVECPQLDDRALGAWIREQTKSQGKEIGGEAVTELIERAGGRLSDVANSLNIVSSYVGTATTIRAQDVVAACADVAEDTVWMLTDAIAQSDMEKALRTLHQLFDMGKSPDEILGTINWLLENAYQAAPGTPYEVKSKFVERKVLPLAEKLGVAKLKDAFPLCTNTHFLTRTTGTDKELLVELLVAKLAAPRPKRPRRAAAG